MSNPALIRAYLENALRAVVLSPQFAEALLSHALELLVQHPPTSSALPLPSVQYSIGLDPGIRRAEKPNEDYAFASSVVVSPTVSPIPGGLFLVADGMGGHADGREASHLAVHTVVDYVYSRLFQVEQQYLPKLLEEGIQLANQAIYQQNIRRGMLLDRGAMMGTTITVAIYLGTTMCIANVGDSRAYLLRQSEPLHQVTRDHSIVADLVARGEIRPEDVRSHPKRNQIYRCLGERSFVDVDTFELQLQAEDILLLCSDGLWEMIPDDKQIEEVLSSGFLSAEQMTECLVQLARCYGGYDNISALVVQTQALNVEDMPTILFPLSKEPVEEDGRMVQNATGITTFR